MDRSGHGGRRPHAGRRGKGRGPARNITLYLPEALIQLLDAEAQRTQTSRADTIIRIVEKSFGLDAQRPHASNLPLGKRPC